MKIAILLALLGVVFALPVAKREEPASSYQAINNPYLEELETELDNDPNDTDSQESNSEESDEIEGFLQSILDFLNFLVQSDDSREDSNEDISNFNAFIFGIFWEPAGAAEYLTPEV